MRDLQAARGTPLTPDTTGTLSSSARSRKGLLAACASVTLVFDVVTKVWAAAELTDRSIALFGGWIVLHETRNSGAAFSIGGSATIVFTAVAAVVIVAIVRTARRLRSRGWAVTLGLLLGGATGNLVDRALRDPSPLRGRVVDFIDLQYDGRSIWPVFNVADMAIVCGGVLAVLLAWRGIEIDGRRTRRRDTEV